MIRRKMKAIAAVTVLSLGLMVPGAHMWTAGTETGAEEEVLLEVEAPDTVAEESSEAESTAVETDTVSETEAESETVSETVTAEETTADAVTVTETEVETDTEAEETVISETEEVTESQLLIGAGDDQSAEPVEEPTTDPAENDADSEKEPMLLGKTTAYSDVESAALVGREGMKNRLDKVSVNCSLAGAFDNKESVESAAIKLGESIYQLAVEHTGNPDEGDYLLWHNLRAYLQRCTVQNISITDGTANFEIVYKLRYLTTYDEEKEVQDAVEDTLTNLNLDQYDTNYEKVFAIYNYICTNVIYSDAKADDDDYYRSHSAYGAIIEEAAKCQGYALMFYRLALSAGIDNRLVSGAVGNQAHGWNLVQIGENYYYVDATFDRNKTNYDYFLLGSERLTDRSIDDTEKNFANNTGKYPIGLTYVFPNGEPHTHITGWKSDGNGMEDTHHSYCYLCGEIEKTEPHSWDEGQLVTIYLNEEETVEDIPADELLDAEEDEEDAVRKETAIVYTCLKCGEVHVEELTDDVVPQNEEATGGEVLPGEAGGIVIDDMPDEPDTPISPAPANIADDKDDEPVLLDQKTPRQLPKTKAPENKPVETSDPTQLGADVFMMITMFGIMAACLPMMLKKRKL